eukprot:CAMPEP_0170190426 /NCGR_PEP_ID=MMETSP0040_2-20121228/49358_1 /TAXON_ID=641309 /ORGANISM="Lotharella oceanica, Strain CCMP622" /LENGTH=61 /DNA_ID=CAMNT_0010438279 /DNA_START=24 /DNA_END=206 /DNA_ORIENTATION=-
MASLAPEPNKGGDTVALSASGTPEEEIAAEGEGERQLPSSLTEEPDPVVAKEEAPRGRLER